MTAKERATEILETLPDDASWGEVLDAFLLDQALEEAVDAVDRGSVVAHDDVIRRFKMR